MHVDKRPEDFSDPDTKHLVTTKVMRDEINRRNLRNAIAGGQPGLRIAAINSEGAASIDDDEIGLTNELTLCIGARVMVTHNLCISHGLVNGTTGIVHDIIDCRWQGDHPSCTGARSKTKTWS